MAVERVKPPAGGAKVGPAAGERTEDPGKPASAHERRSFLKLAWLAVAAAALAESAWVVASFLKPRPKAARSAGSLVVAGPSETFAAGSVTAFPTGKFYLVRLADGGFLALHRQCTHLGCSVPWDEASAKFVCPCHASAFDLRGDVLAPPAPRPLDLFAVRIENGIVKVDVSAPIRRSAFDASQVVRG